MNSPFLYFLFVEYTCTLPVFTKANQKPQFLVLLLKHVSRLSANDNLWRTYFSALFRTAHTFQKPNMILNTCFAFSVDF